MTYPILVIHGVANRDEQAFRAVVADLEQQFAGRYEFKAGYWGDLGANADFIADTLPDLEEVRAAEQLDATTVEAIAAGLLASSPAPVVVKEGMGHSSITTTEKHLHPLDGADETALEAFASVRHR